MKSCLDAWCHLCVVWIFACVLNLNLQLGKAQVCLQVGIRSLNHNIEWIIETTLIRFCLIRVLLPQLGSKSQEFSNLGVFLGSVPGVGFKQSWVAPVSNRCQQLLNLAWEGLKGTLCPFFFPKVNFIRVYWLEYINFTSGLLIDSLHFLNHIPMTHWMS